MPTQINQIDDPERKTTTFRVEGDMLLADAELLRRIALDTREINDHAIVIDLADLDFMDSESAPVLLHLQSEDGFEIVGTEIFLQHVVNDAERVKTDI